MTRRMSDPAFRAAQLQELYAAHVKPVNKLVDELRVGPDGWMPHVAPLHGGTEARLLLLASDPGPAPADPYQALLSIEDDTARAARLGALLRMAGVDPGETLPWCAFPWYAEHPPAAGDVKAGVEPLRRLVLLLERLEVVVLLGPPAERSWRMLTSTHPFDVPPVQVLATRDTEDDAFAGTKAQRKRWREEQALVFLEAGRLLHGAS
ncbi:hypothetical protein acdb102_36370 [Acidothermaceae bacterium B102]|nr:hypothetical protein acdb102_36370 [Acidothermaceae bacterium B102]